MTHALEAVPITWLSLIGSKSAAGAAVNNHVSCMDPHHQQQQLR